MKTTHYTINIATANPHLAAKIAERLAPFYSSNQVTLAGNVTVIDDDPNAIVHIDAEAMSVPDMQKLAKDKE